MFSAGIALAVATLLAGCGSEDGTAVRAPASDSAARQTGSGECATSADGYLSATRQAGEPEVSVPRVDGWDRISQFENQAIRLAAANRALTVDKFSPNYVVTVEKAPADGRAEFDRQIRALTSLAEEGTVRQHPESETCGYPSVVVDYQLTAPGGTVTHATMLIVSVADDSSSTTTTLTIQSPEPNDPEYAAAEKTIIEGVRITK